MAQPRMRISGAVIGAGDPMALAAFYERLLGWTMAKSYGARPGYPPEDGWVMLRPASEGFALSFQWEQGYKPPVWPTAPGEQQMMVHLDIAVEDLDAGVAWALDAGATLADYQPQEDVRVMLDPAGHPFCLFKGQV